MSLTFWLIIIFTVIVGLAVGWFISKIEWIPPLVLGGMLGWIFSLVLYQLALKYIQSNPDVVYWLTVAVSIVIGIVLGYYLPSHILIIATSFIGAYAIIRGLSFVFGHFPNEGEIVNIVKEKKIRPTK